MRRFLEKVSLGGALLFVASSGFAQGVKPPLSCAPIEQELSSARRALDQTQRELLDLRSRAAEAEATRAELVQREQDLSAKQGAYEGQSVLPFSWLAYAGVIFAANVPLNGEGRR